eukprot:NODE_7654_length_1560_cov_20.866015.p1 GENE.NODE_7654_length_1560_cov_20.866015~~NODE_7654_length_1560_cov_20.866015.p1  ORF type:complete len:390 (+),score=74.47 NODE_7654_length_1560_cov_20.866015:153-1322(+)
MSAAAAVSMNYPTKVLPMLENLGDPRLLVVSFLPVLLIGWAVTSRSKTVASFAQLSGLQERSAVRKQITEACLSVDKAWFVTGVANLAVTAYILGGWPEYYYLYFTPKVIVLTILRWVTFRRKKQHYLLMDFCYWANFVCIYYCWMAPSNYALFQAVFLCATGPVAWSALAFNHALIFHSYAHSTSAVIHLSPMLLCYGLRWYPGSHFTVCPPDGCLSVPVLDLFANALGRFYLWWIVLYYVWIFVLLGDYIEQNGYQTLWDRILTMKVLGLGPGLKGMLKRGWPKLCVQFVYLCIHLLFALFTFCIASVLWYSQLAGFLFLAAVATSTVVNAADFYFDLFESQYDAALKVTEDPTTTMTSTPSGLRAISVRKRLAAASPGLASLQSED